MVVVHVAVFLAGAVLVVATLLSAVRTVVLPRAIPAVLTRYIFITSRALFGLRTSRARTYEDRDRIMALYAPLTLLLLPGVWLVLVLGGYTAMFWSLGAGSLRSAYATSGSSLLTLGFKTPGDLPSETLAFSEAALGIGLLALLISYLPSIYGSFNRRETLIALLESRAGTPPSAVELMLRFHRIGGIDRLDALWPPWEQWFADVQESHTSLPALVFFRSPDPRFSWVTAAGAVLDAAAFTASSIDVPPPPEAALTVRAGFLCLRRIGDFFQIPYDPDPQPTDPISVSRDEFEQMWDRLAAEAFPLKPDRDAAWRAFAGWRVNYDSVLVALAGLTMAPLAPWSSDRSTNYRRPTLKFWRRSL
jgi:hypothetical protein